MKLAALAIRAHVSLLFVALGCASAGARAEADLEASLTRGGGLSGVTETVHVWSINATATADLRRSNSRRTVAVHLSNATLLNILAELDSLAGSLPPGADTGSVVLLCGDAVTTHLTVRRRREVRVAHEACPRGSAALDAYWSRVDSLFRVLANAAR